MKILLLSTYDLHGGAARAAFRLCEGLVAAGHEITMVVQHKEGSAAFVQQPDHFSYKRFSKFRGYFDLLPGVLLSRKKILFSIGWLNSRSVEKKIREFDPDIIHIHWINKGFINLKSLAGLNKPIIWTLHDMWAFTGGCHYAYGCERFNTGCGRCPLLRSGKENDLSSFLYARKKVVYERISSMTIVTPSHWMTNLAMNSGIFGRHLALTIPNAINVDIFRNIDMDVARTRLGLPVNRKLLLFNAMNATTDERKGYKYLLEAIAEMDLTTIELVVVGSDRLSGMEPDGLKVHLKGIIRDSEAMAQCYSACNVFVLPSLQDNLPNTVMEALACGTPVVAFNTGGIPDMVEHKMNGYLAKYMSAGDLAKGISWCLYESDGQDLSNFARNKVLKNFSEDVVIQKYVDLYRQVLQL